MARAVTTIALAFLAAYVILCLLLYFFQRSLIYFPQPRTDIPGTELLRFKSGDVVLNVTAWQRHKPEAVMYFGGNAEDAGFGVPDLANTFPGHAVYALHYRSYGGSEGKPSEEALVKDALSLFDDISNAHKAIVVVGRSLGSGVAIRLASERRVARLILVTPYDSIQNLAASQFPYVPVRWLLKDSFESWRYAKEVSAPTVVIAAEHDEVIPRTSTEALARNFRPGLVQFKVVRGVGHNTISESPEYPSFLSGSR